MRRVHRLRAAWVPAVLLHVVWRHPFRPEEVARELDVLSLLRLLVSCSTSPHSTTSTAGSTVGEVVARHACAAWEHAVHHHGLNIGPVRAVAQDHLDIVILREIRREDLGVKELRLLERV